MFIKGNKLKKIQNAYHIFNKWWHISFFHSVAHFGFFPSVAQTNPTVLILSCSILIVLSYFFKALRVICQSVFFWCHKLQIAIIVYAFVCCYCFLWICKQHLWIQNCCQALSGCQFCCFVCPYLSDRPSLPTCECVFPINSTLKIILNGWCLAVC